MARRIRSYLPPQQRVPITESAQIRARVEHETSSTARVFISHKTLDHYSAKEVGEDLSKAGLGVYFVEDDPNVPPGDRDRLPDQIKDVMRQCAGLLVYASPRLEEDAAWVCYEIGLADMRRWMVTARYTREATVVPNLLSPIRGLKSVEDEVSEWAVDVRIAQHRLLIASEEGL